ncbi:MAG TPA: 16S rRNA (uracil(1498)-N(3))-methyltransferase [Polyangiaceae bacterium]|nr:16S rRNA (uracil(1498)-N(3))-methyltransferase [Polyangiaceae bacterium]
MVRLHVDPERLAGETVVVTDEDHRYLTRVLRLATGSRVTLFDGRGVEADAEVIRVGPRAVELRVLARREAPPPRGPTLTLIQALARGEKLDLVVQKTTELGVHRILPVTTARAVPRLEPLRSSSRLARWQKIATQAARQSGRADVPEVQPVVGFPIAIAAAPRDALKLLLFEGAKGQGLKQALGSIESPPATVVVAIGPEGGFTDEEVARAKEAGFTVAGLGPRILRTETAALVALAIVGYALGDLG